MTWEIWVIYVATVLAFMSTPGPSHLLMLSNSMSHGFRPSLATAAGDLSANALQMLAAGLGLAAIIVASQNALTVIKWLGVAYLLWLGIKMLRRSSGDAQPGKVAQKARVKTLWMQGFLTSAANPKAVVFFAALFPQFMDGAKPFATQFLILSVTYIAIDGAFLAGYGATAGWLAKKLKGKATAMLDKLGGTFLIVAALLLGLKTLREAD